LLPPENLKVNPARLGESARVATPKGRSPSDTSTNADEAREYVESIARPLESLGYLRSVQGE
jgi:hypothetical protein